MSVLLRQPHGFEGFGVSGRAQLRRDLPLPHRTDVEAARDLLRAARPSRDAVS